MRKAKPAEIRVAGACGCRMRGLSRQAWRSSPAARCDPRRGKPQPGSRESRIISSTFTTSRPLTPEGSGYSVGQPSGHLSLCHNGPVFHPRRLHQMDRVAVAPEGAGSGRDIICENPVAALAFELEAGVLDHVVGLRRKADNESRPIIAALRDARQDVWVLGKAEQRRAAPVFFQLMHDGAL